MTNDLFEKKRIYVNYGSQISSKSRNEWIFIYKIILILFFFSGILTLFLKLDSSLFPQFLVKSNRGSLPLQDFISFETPLKQQNNAIVLIRFTILSFVFLFSIFKNFTNINTQKERIKHYLIFYILYLSLSIISFTLFFTFISKTNEQGTLIKYEPYQYLQLIFLLIPLAIVNTLFEIYNYLIKRKSDPILYKSSIPLIIQIASQTLLLAFVLINFGLWIKYSREGLLFRDTPQNEQKYWNFIEEIFNIKSLKNLLIVIASFALIVFLIIGSNAIKLQRLSEKNIYKAQDKDRFLLSVIFLIVSIIWLSTLLFKEPIKYSLSGPEYKYNLKNSFVVILSAFVTLLYFLVSYLKFTKTKNPIGLSVRFAVVQLLIWIPMMISVITVDNSNINLINLLVASIFSLVTFIHYMLTNKFIQKTTFALLSLLFASKIIFILILGLNHVLLGNNNHVLTSIPTPISILKIISITYVSLLIILFLFETVQLQITIMIKILKEKNLKLEKEN
ncbi:MSC_0624 family F1-like ATPase-associated membrane protein [Mycoplasmopsis canis]|uniref:MSC_0624 family F1-like ATPase-associated membrane protein n=1 Tax=Mycoplasmopsis canis TaxID=29555 RepID=UPI0003026302|nr:hypothetical protein [Mycoplasmopsis canis]